LYNRSKIVARITIVCLFTAVLALPVVFYPQIQRCSFAAQTVFYDIQPDEQVYPFVKYLAEKNLLVGYPDGSFHPGDPISRAEMATLLVRAGELPGQRPATPTFKDVEQQHWAYDMIEAAVEAGLVKGEPDGLFRPEDPVTRAETAALLLRLTRVPLPAVTLPGAIQDVNSSHWAWRQVAAALDAGLLIMSTNNYFGPDIPATRTEVTRGLAFMLNISPERAEVPMSITLARITGEVMLREPGREFSEITADTTCGKGATIKTGPGGRAELRFTDGSSLRLEENTELIIKKTLGQSTILRDGSQGAVVDCLEADLTKGKIFGMLAATYYYSHYSPFTAPLPTNSPPAQQGGDAESSPWWRKIFEERSRVIINMPWCTAEIKGSLWMNEVRTGQQVTNVVDGLVYLNAAGHTVAIPAGQTSSVSSPATPPALPVRMPADEQTVWLKAEQWVYEQANAIENIYPVITPPVPITEQVLPVTSSAVSEVVQSVNFLNPPNQVADEIIQAFNRAISDVINAQPGSSNTHGKRGGGGDASDNPEDTAPPIITGVDLENNATGVPSGKKVTVTFSENVQAGSAYSDIIIKDATGNIVPVDKSINGQTLVLAPVNDLSCSAPVSGVITVTFDMALRDAANVPIQLIESGTVRTVYGQIRDNQLTAPYSDLNYSTVYTVTIPPGSVESRDYLTSNDEISWIFTTRAAP